MATHETYYERKFVQWVTSVGGKAFKGPAMLYKGIPDRIVVLPNGGGTVWVEFKNDVYHLTPMQVMFRDMLMASDPERYINAVDQAGLDACIAKCEQLMNMKDNKEDNNDK